MLSCIKEILSARASRRSLLSRLNLARSFSSSRKREFCINVWSRDGDGVDVNCARNADRSTWPGEPLLLRPLFAPDLLSLALIISHPIPHGLLMIDKERDVVNASRGDLYDYSHLPLLLFSKRVFKVD